MLRTKKGGRRYVYAVSKDNLEIAKLLIEAGTDKEGRGQGRVDAAILRRLSGQS